MHRASRIIIKRLEVEDNPKKAFKPEEDQGYISILPVIGAKKRPQKPKDTLKGLRARTA